MIIDRRLQVSAMQAFTANAVSTDTIDLGVDRRIGPGEPMWMVTVVRAASGTSPTLQVTVQTDDNSAFSSPATVVASAVTPAVVGAMIVTPISFTNERHLRNSYTVGGTSPNITVDSWLTNQDPTSWIALPDAI